MHSEILNNRQRELLPLMALFRREYYLVGGTAIALFLGHRRSIDFDLFKPGAINHKRNLDKIAATPFAHTVTRRVAEQMNLIVNNVKVTFFLYPFPVEPTARYEQKTQKYFWFSTHLFVPLRQINQSTMEVIQSFTIDHTQLKPGIYVSREDKGFTTFDLRITEPNKEPAVAPAAMHSLEHLMATWFRNSEAKDDVVYVGPMGCLTGMYIIMTGSYTAEDMRRLTIECLKWILTQDEVPATEPQSCGNYLLHDLPMCKWESARYLDRLQHDFHCEYTKLQITLDDGKVFADA